MKSFSNKITSPSTIPVNKYKTLDNIFKTTNTNIPNGHQVLHPFYSPNILERGILCMTEVRPCLLDGEKIIPAVIKVPKNFEDKIVNGIFVFDTVKGMNQWIQIFVRARNSYSKLSLIEGEYEIRASKLHGLLSDCFPFFPNISNSVSKNDITMIVKTLIERPNVVIYTEEVFLYLLQEYPKLTYSIMDSLVEFIGTRIEEKMSIQMLIAQSLKNLKNFEIDKEYLKIFDKMLCTVERKVEIKCYKDFDPGLRLDMFAFFIKHHSLKNAKSLLSEFIKKGECPSLKLIEEYLKLIDIMITPTIIGPTVLLRQHKFAYISDLAPILNQYLTSTMVKILLPYCKHSTELFNLVSLIENSSESRKIFTETSNNLIQIISVLTNNNLTNSMNLSILLRRIKPYFGNSLHQTLLLEFIKAYILNHNFAMAATLLDQIVEPIDLNFYKNLTTIIEQESGKPPPNDANNLSGFTKNDRELLLKYILESKLGEAYDGIFK